MQSFKALWFTSSLLKLKKWRGALINDLDPMQQADDTHLDMK